YGGQQRFLSVYAHAACCLDLSIKFGGSNRSCLAGYGGSMAQSGAMPLFDECRGSSDRYCQRLQPLCLSGGYFGNSSTNLAQTHDGRVVSGMFSPAGFGARIDQCKDGMSNTLLMGEIRPHCSLYNSNTPYMCCSGGVAFTTGPIN